MPKIVDYDARRREIAAAATSVLARDGIQEATLAKVADRCGMGRTTLYQYFKDIDELVELVLADTFERLGSEAAALRADRSLGPTERLIGFLRYLEREAVLDRERMILVLDFLLHPRRRLPGMAFDVPEHVRSLRAQLEAVLAEAVTAGELRPLDSKSMAFTLFAFIEAATVHGALYGNISFEDTMRDLELLVDGLRARAP
jgi:AcrR family transcriptional regulator